MWTRKTQHSLLQSKESKAAWPACLAARVNSCEKYTSAHFLRLSVVWGLWRLQTASRGGPEATGSFDVDWCMTVAPVLNIKFSFSSAFFPNHEKRFLQPKRTDNSPRAHRKLQIKTPRVFCDSPTVTKTKPASWNREAWVRFKMKKKRQRKPREETAPGVSLSFQFGKSWRRMRDWGPCTSPPGKSLWDNCWGALGIPASLQLLLLRLTRCQAPAAGAHSDPSGAVAPVCGPQPPRSLVRHADSQANGSWHWSGRFEGLRNLHSTQKLK